MPIRPTLNLFMRSRTAIGFQWVAFVVIYVALDWASYLHALYGLNITPWNPALAFGLVVWLRVGRLTAIPWFGALVLGELLIRGLPASLWAISIYSIVLLTGYGVLAESVRKLIGVESALSSQRLFLSWLLVVFVGTLLTSILFIASLVVMDLIPSGGWRMALMRFWIGDFVGVFVTMPFFLLLLIHRELFLKTLLRAETLGYLSIAGATLWIAFGLGGNGEFQYFYLLFIPLVWAAARYGIAGAAIAAFFLQGGVIIAVQILNLVAVTVFELQMLGAALAFVGFFIGVVIDEKQRVSAELRQTLHFAAAGEMAGALAHEINQPLSALTIYGAACQQLIVQGDHGPRLQDVIQKMVTESFRAGEIIRRLREFFRTGSTHLEAVRLGDLVQSSTAAFVDKAMRKGIELQIDVQPECDLLIDRLQIEVVFRNILSNAFDAVAEQPEGKRLIRISFSVEKNNLVSICFQDSGPGVARTAHLFEPFHSTKTAGLGLGLVISRAIAVAHGGNLNAVEGEHGCFILELPTERIAR